MAGNYSFNISILCLNPFQVQIGDYSYTYRDYDPESMEQWKNGFGPGSLEEKLQYELEDFYNGDFFDEFGTYPGLRGPGGGGYSASSYVRDVASGSITPEAEVRSRTGFELQVEMNFDKDKILANNGEGVKKVESDLRYVIETAFKNSVAYKKEVYLDPIFTRDNMRRASNNPTFSSNGKPDPGYTPNGKTYSIPQTPDFKLNKSFASETTDDYYLSYIINEITPTPKKEPIAGSPSEPVGPTGASPSVIAATPSNDGLIRGEYVFNVEKSKIFSNPELGELSIVEQVVGGEAEEDTPLFIFDDSQGDDPLDSEYVEGAFIGEEESAETIPLEDFNQMSSMTIDQTEGEVKEDYSTSPENSGNAQAVQGSGSSDTLKPTKKGYLQGSAFTKTNTSGNSWNVKVDTTYRLTGFKFGKPTITEKSFVARVKKAEGGIANGTSDNAYRTYGDKTVVPISKKGYKDEKKYDKLCTNGKGKRLYNIHTSKGIIWVSFKGKFGDSISAQERYLKMSDDDWWTIMKEKFLTPNKADKIKSKIASYFWAYWCWGSGAGGAIELLNRCLNLLSGSSNFSGGSISDKHINYMNDLYNSGKEDQLISAMYDVRIQKLLNISQPGNDNSVYRNGWINGINSWIQEFHET